MTFSSKAMAAVLFWMFGAAYLLTPWWYFYPDRLTQIGYLSAAMAIGTVWSFFSAGDLSLRIDAKRHLLFFGLIAAVLFAVHAPALFQNIAFMGDEDFHIGVLLTLRHFVSLVLRGMPEFAASLWAPVVLVSAALIGAAAHLARRKRSLFPVFCAASLAAIVLFASALLNRPWVEATNAFSKVYRLPFFTVDHFMQYEILRYPILQKWIDLIFVFADPHRSNVLFRMVPFLSVVLLAGYLYVRFDQMIRSRPLSAAFALAVVTMPLVVYYTGLLYPDTAATMLLTIAVFSVRSIVTEPFSVLKRHPAWYLLILASFIKETSAISLAAILTVRFLYRGRAVLARPGTPSAKASAAIREALACALPLVPVGCFVALWSIEGSLRTLPNSFRLEHLFIGSHYAILGKELLVEFGAWAPLALAGALVAWRKDRAVFWATASLFAANLLFFLSEGKYVGFSRFNLPLLPAVIYWAYCLLGRIGSKPLLVAMVSLCVFFNFWLKPIHADGSRVRNWGNPVFASGEATYPYEPAIRRLAAIQDGDRLLTFGNSYPYYLIEYYMEKYDYRPASFREGVFPPIQDRRSEEAFFYLFLKNLQTEPSRILYHSQWNIDARDEVTRRFHYAIDTRIRNQENSIYILKRITEGENADR